MKLYFYLTVFNMVLINTQKTNNYSSVDVYGPYFTDLLTAVENVSLNAVLHTTTSLSILHCNEFCNGTTVTKIVDRGCSSSIPICKTCRCDTDCEEYGDCCPDESFNMTMTRENRHVCVSGINKQYSFSGSHTGYYLITTCPDESNRNMSASQISGEDISPVTSTTTNITYLNEMIAECYGDNIIIRWEKENVCDKYPSQPNINESPTDCLTFHPPSDPLPRSCDTNFADEKYIDSCNQTGLWDGSFSEIAEEQCRHGIYYPVATGKYAFKNIFCYVCNGLTPSAFKCVQQNSGGGYSINSLVCTHCDRQKCMENEWYDWIKNECRAMLCRSGYYLKGGKCQLTDVGLSRVEYQFAVLFWPTGNNTSDPRLQDWNFIEPMVVRNIPLVAKKYNMTYYMFSVYIYLCTLTLIIVPNLSVCHRLD
ncbi:uncharacterized protein LOC124263843 isoform X2 [Haliotis rubra]|nr:uncharacterized protein LOC124263843 isoform X2 [Haliotis rubra]